MLDKRKNPNTGKKSYSTFSAAKALNIPRTRLFEWIRLGFVVPSVKAKGKGTKTIFSDTDMKNLTLFADLVKLGFRRKVAQEMISDHGRLPKMIETLKSLGNEKGGAHA